MSDNSIHHFELLENDLGTRIDKIIHQKLQNYTRDKVKKLIQNNKVQIDNAVINKPSFTPKSTGNVKIFDDINIEKKTQKTQPLNYSLEQLFEDEHLLIINKPAGLIVHPGAGQPMGGTLMDLILSSYTSSHELERAGIVHRLDRLTSGVMVVAKSLKAYNKLVAMFKKRDITRIYHAICYGNLLTPKIVEASIDRSKNYRTLMSVSNEGKYAKTIFKPIKQLQKATLVECHLSTGRTHQIRVHAKHIRYPIFGDPDYSKSYQHPCSFNRQALHAKIIRFLHPITEKPICIECPYPNDFKSLLDKLTLDKTS